MLITLSLTKTSYLLKKQMSEVPTLYAAYTVQYVLVFYLNKRPFPDCL